jgi:5-methylcytosine-specific restriction endonuclease McrA
MTLVPDALRPDVEQRAAHRCEYCHVSTRGQVATFHVDHVQPVSDGGLTALANLALTCPPCNGHKWLHTEGRDPATGQTCQLFNPRSDNWSEHFEWSGSECGLLVGKTAFGRATIARLQINHPYQVETRRLLARLGLFPEVLASSSTQAGEPL